MNLSPNVPFNPKKSPFFYGYVILVMGVLGNLMSIPGQTMGVSVFTDHLILAMGLSRFELSLAYMVGTILSSLMLTKAGSYYDKIGARKSVFVASVFMGMVLLFLSQIDKVSLFLKKFLVIGSTFLIPFIIMSLGFFMIRFLGQGCLTLFSRNMIQSWFDKKRGFANAIVALAVSFGFSAAPKFFNYLIDKYNWYGAWQIMGVALVFIFPIIVLIFFRDNPQESGLEPDGNNKTEQKGKNTKKIVTTGEDMTLAQAQKTMIFWVYTLGISLFSFFATAITFHIVSIFKEAGLDEAQAIAIFIPSAFISVGISFLASWLADYIKLKWHLIALVLGLIIATIGLLVLKQPYGTTILIIGYGISVGLFSVIASLVFPRFFGLKNLGAISGRSMAILVFASAIGPASFGFAKDKLGGYYILEVICLVISMVLLILSIIYGAPKKILSKN